MVFDSTIKFGNVSNRAGQFEESHALHCLEKGYKNNEGWSCPNCQSRYLRKTGKLKLWYS